ncbi:hypothetical protein RBH26_21295, partial [Natronolimnohabitans sp. A-GB9]|uniref:hypothetical protein n=1 Tax=Natronolimnohabitans sp. A-GB9 TaxID=3069757 RepID=UPI0027AE288F
KGEYPDQMTLTIDDRNRVSEDISPFGAQSRLDRDLPNVIKNMLREFASHPDVPNAIELSEHVIREVCDQREIGPVSLDIETRLSAEFNDLPFEARYEDGLTADDLRTKIEEPQYSYPAVELALERYDPPEYDIQMDKNGHARKLRVLVMALNHDSVLLYDPLRYSQVSSNNGMEATEVDKPMFLRAWKGRLESTSTLWVEATEQKRLTEY